MSKQRLYTRLGGFVALVVLIGGMIFDSFEKSENETTAINLECYGVITDFTIDGNHSTPYFHIDNEWVYLNMYGHDIKYEVQVGDSVAKKRREDVLYLYRKERSRYNLIKMIEY
ncbi:MAG: hypothetical protein HRT61_20755 [Ekhidna sp.]|nr:hypothetical protein [Ekhidna sp.]